MRIQHPCQLYGVLAGECAQKTAHAAALLLTN
jgi:hypothetical protein